MPDQTSDTYYFEQLTPEEKRRVIAALSMGKLSEDEKRQFARACTQSRLTDEEKKQIRRAFALSNMTDEERRALLEKKKTAASSAAASSAAASSAARETAADGAAMQTQAVRPVSRAERTDEETRQISAADASQELRQERKQQTAAELPTAHVPEKTVQTAAEQYEAGRHSGHTNQRHVNRRQREDELYGDEDPNDIETDTDDGTEEHDHTALTSLLKGVVYIVAVLIVSIFASYAIISVGNDVFAFVKSDEVVTVVIEEDMTTTQVAEMLHVNGIIRFPTVYELYMRVKKASSNYLVGEYEVSPSMNYKQLNRLFTYVESTKTQVVVTIPEGYTVDQMIDLFLSYGIGTREGFVDTIENYPFDEFRFIDELPTRHAERKYRLEGYLFPDTYFFFVEDSEVAVIYKILQNFQKKVTDAYYDRAKEMGMTMDQVITLASMLQAEGNSQTDFENISSVFHNRLDHAREYPLLQSDATLQYILDKRKTALTASDLKINSHYNTYLYPGLPPSAICNPGLDAIDCALYPAATKYYYFLADGHGNTYFSETLEEHEKLKAQYIG